MRKIAAPRPKLEYCEPYEIEIGLPRNMPSNKLHWTADITEERDMVFATVKLNGQEIFRLRDPSPKRAIVRSGRPSAAVLKARLKYHAEHDRQLPTIRAQAEFYADCRRRDLEREVLELRKSLRRIKEQVACIVLAEQIRRGEGA